MAAVSKGPARNIPCVALRSENMSLNGTVCIHLPPDGVRGLHKAAADCAEEGRTNCRQKKLDSKNACSEARSWKCCGRGHHQTAGALLKWSWWSFECNQDFVINKIPLDSKDRNG